MALIAFVLLHPCAASGECITTNTVTGFTFRLASLTSSEAYHLSILLQLGDKLISHLDDIVVSGSQLICVLKHGFIKLTACSCHPPWSSQ